MKKSDHELGMFSNISRRDFIHVLSLASLSVALPTISLADEQSSPNNLADYYPPTKTGLRGSHPGAFENAHLLAREGKKWPMGKDTGEHFDLVVVGGGISGLASAYYYRKKYPSARVLILENHDEFGGHARRNEFHQGGQMRLAWGGVMNLEYHNFSDTTNSLLSELGIDLKQLIKKNDFHYGYDGKKGPAIYFDKETFGRDVLSTPCSFRDFSLELLADKVDEFPISANSCKSLKDFVNARKDVRKKMSSAEVHQMMHKTSYTGFLVKYGKLTQEAADLFIRVTDGYWGVSAHSLSVAECIGAGVPIKHILGEPHLADDNPVGGTVAMYPDGNASIARLLVRKLIPSVTEAKDSDDIVTAKFDYSQLDKSDSAVKLRLNSTAINIQNENEKNTVSISYVQNNEVLKVNAKHCVMACYHSIIPYLCPELPQAQKAAARYQVKRPLLLTNVLLRNSKAANKLGIGGAYCPGRIHGATWLVKGVNSKDYQQPWSDDGPVSMMFWGALAASDSKLDIKAQHRDSRMRMLELTFEDYEREVRTVLDGMLGPAGFDVKHDILAITVNRWPHGYSYDYLDLWDPEFPVGEAPHEIARQPFGNIAIANSDAGANALTNVAIDEAFRAINDLPTE